MARVNLDDSFFYDPRFAYLGKLLGIDQFSAEARVIRVWKFCTEQTRENLTEDEINTHSHWFNDGGKCFADALVQAKLAETIPTNSYGPESLRHIRIKGAKERFAWLVERRRASKRGGKATKETFDHLKSIANEGQKRAKRKPKDSQMAGQTRPSEGPLDIVPSLDLVIDPDLDLDPDQKDLSEGRISDEIHPVEICENVVIVKNELRTQAKRGRPKSNPDGERRFVGEYVQAYNARWKTRPALDGKTLGEIRRLVRDFGVERASALMQAYLQIDDPRFVKECHPFNLLMLNLNRLSVALDRGIEKPHEGDSWDRFWAKVDTGGTGDARSISGAANAVARPVG